MYLESLAEGEHPTMKGYGVFYAKHRNFPSLAVLSHRGGSRLFALAQARRLKDTCDDASRG